MNYDFNYLVCGLIPIGIEAFEDSLKVLDYTKEAKGHAIEFRERHNQKLFAVYNGSMNKIYGSKEYFS